VDTGCSIPINETLDSFEESVSMGTEINAKEAINEEIELLRRVSNIVHLKSWMIDLFKITECKAALQASQLL
jgi:hypothetical protein